MTRAMPLSLQDPDRDTSFLDLVSRARDGDREASNELFRRFLPRVRVLVQRSLASDVRLSRPWLSARFSTGDVVQETLWSAFSRLDAFQGETERSFSAYLAMIVRNRIVDAIRFHEADRRDGRRPVHSLEERLHPSREQSFTRAVDAGDSVARLHELLEELPERERLLVRARLDGTATFAELAERLGYPSVTTARRVFFGLQAQLAVRLGEDDAPAGPGGEE